MRIPSTGGEWVKGAVLGLCLLSACTKEVAKPPPPPPVPVAASAVTEDVQFPVDDLGAAATGCAQAADCVAVSFGGSCWPVVTGTLTGPLAERYRRWAEAGFAKPSGSPMALTAVPTEQFTSVCSPNWAEVTCINHRCALRPAECEYGGMKPADCEAKGGEWGGCVMGRGRIPGCNLPTKDSGKACTDSTQCEGACVDGTCTALHHYKGCGIMVDGKTMCAE